VDFFSYRTKRAESQAGDQLRKFSRQCSIFGRIGDQWVAISSPETEIIFENFDSEVAEAHAEVLDQTISLLR